MAGGRHRGETEQADDLDVAQDGGAHLVRGRVGVRVRVRVRVGVRARIRFRVRV